MLTRLFQQESPNVVHLNLTALLDVLTNLLFFVMLGAASIQANVHFDDALELPGSTAVRSTARLPLQISIGRQDIRFNQQPIVSVRRGYVSLGAANYNQRIEPLFQQLQAFYTQQQAAAKKQQELVGDDVIVIYCDRQTPYGLIRQVLETAKQAGYVKFRMAVTMQ